MRHTPLFDVTDPEVVAALIDRTPWATITSVRRDGSMVASHYPVLRDASSDELTLLTHVGKPDDDLHEFRDADVLVVFQADVHGYISPSWYAAADLPVPTWNFSAVHCWGRPELLDADENVSVLASLTDHFEQHIADRRVLEPAVAARIAKHALGLRIPVDRFTCKVKMSQNKSPETQQRVIDALEREGEPFADPALAAEMRRVLGLPAS
ncbi:MAG: FMN-binding negative transcriptional regulator [Solirubrobacteraceae bacterium]|nr:FMN-binding negative transcriptional regulator [Solirubrobacteraceae bacterium]